MSATFSRREFLRTGAAAGSGLIIAIHVPGCAPRSRRQEGPVETPLVPNAFLKVGTDGSVIVLVGYSEMGQGVLTAVPQLVAEELDVEWERVRVEQAPAGEAYFNPAFGLQGTGGSTTVRSAWQPMREAGARARAMLIAAAAAEWGVPATECWTEPGFVAHRASGKRRSYGELAASAATMTAPAQVNLKDAKNFRIIGKAVPRLDLPDKVTGRAQFGIDARPPGVLVAVIARCPTYGGKPVRWNDAAAKVIAGVRHVVPISSGVAVVGDGYWAAHKGREALEVEWDLGRLAVLDTPAIRRQLEDLLERPGIVVRREGRGDLGRATRRIEAVYEVPYLAHACMEPMNCTADVRADGVTIWAPTQFQAGAGFGGGSRELGARIGGVPVEKVTVHTTLLGGGFGRRFFSDFVVEALECSKAVGAPVKVVWSREDDIRHDFFRPGSLAKFTGYLNDRGVLIGWTNRFACPAILPAGPGKLDDSSHEGLANFPYGVPNVLVDGHNPDVGVPTGFWRSVGSSQNAFFSECFIDEMAQAAGTDPFDYRRALLEKAPRHRRVLEVAAQKAGWGTPLPAGRARGIAVAESFGSYVAEVAEVSREGAKVRVHSVVVAVDCGPYVNPDIIAAQMESGVVYGLTAGLYGEITIREGAAVEANFDSYPLVRFDEMPRIETHIVPSEDSQGGVGEPGVPPIAPAVVNALAALTGERIRRLPLRKALATT